MRDAKLRNMISEFKYKSVRDYGAVFASLLSTVLPCLPKDTIIIPMPTIRRHIRERGFDHAKIIAQQFARQRSLVCKSIVGRAKNTVQVGSDRQTRQTQAKTAYKLLAKPDPTTNYLIIDDVWTTGASLCAVCELLKKAGARHIMTAVLARSTHS